MSVSTRPGSVGIELLPGKGVVVHVPAPPKALKAVAFATISDVFCAALYTHEGYPVGAAMCYYSFVSATGTAAAFARGLPFGQPFRLMGVSGTEARWPPAAS